MIDYSQTSRYFGITEDPDLVQTDLVVLNPQFTETTVRINEVNSPEILSQRIYNNPNYWWVICQYNGILDPKILPYGKKIRYPHLVKPPREDA